MSATFPLSGFKLGYPNTPIGELRLFENEKYDDKPSLS